jgi:hypothetical protein
MIVETIGHKLIMLFIFQADFGHIKFPAGFKSPMTVNLGTFPDTAAHDVSASAITVLDTKRIRIEQFNYDGLGPGRYKLDFQP